MRTQLGIQYGSCSPRASVIQRLQVLPPPPQAGNGVVKCSAALVSIPVERVPILYELLQHAKVLFVGDVPQYLADVRQVGVVQPYAEGLVRQQVLVRLEGVLLQAVGWGRNRSAWVIDVWVGGGMGWDGGWGWGVEGGQDLAAGQC